ncbi:dolichyl-diphosphooligosaccharide--protein glycosyltransferase subunit 2-like [Xenia sp. Carnegie-2017]|uniref:dolichyl-diphosphooligosaccharide--protein glycosyltransferase subunit 2-like n=1 Tax=Xenia sp. Carnegie-2017 TaxID=2897299 RepID=UPI001F042B9A|nr:dolichyl-diphosphooligosaccharide--protein glycosyltransferase subunit 2-like [Xenia sp. Carnegie-2017]
MATRGFWFRALFLLTLVSLGSCVTPRTVLSVDEQSRIKEKLLQDLPDLKNLEDLYYNVASLKFLKSEVPKSKEICSKVNSLVNNQLVESIYYASSVGKQLGNCKVNIENAGETLSASLNGKSSSQTIRFAVEALLNLGLKVEEKRVTAMLKAILQEEKEDFVPCVTNALYVMSSLSGDFSFAFDAIEDAVAQADEIADTYLQFEGGLTVTADFITAVYKLAAHIKKEPTMSEEQAIKFTSYLLSRKYVQSSRDAFYILSSLTMLADNQFQVPLITLLYNDGPISDDNKLLKVKITDVLDKAITDMKVTAESIVDKNDGDLLSNKDFIKEKDFYQIVIMSHNPTPGFYKLALSLKPNKQDKRLIGLSPSELTFKVVTRISIEDISVSIFDKEHASQVSSNSVNYPKGLDASLEADYHQKVVMVFSLKDISSGKLVTAHQTFVRLMNTKTNQEIFFVAEAENNKVYKFDLDVGASAKESFSSLSGEYQMDLIIGDAAIENSLFWNIGSIKLSFSGSSAARVPKEKERLFKIKQEIEHMFRLPEKRPPKTVSTAFTALVLLPLFVLFVAWLRIGVNFSNFQFSISAIGFHIGLGGIFLLMYAFWTSLNMFSTLKILALVGCITFLTGNSLLANLAAQRMKN